MTLEQRREEYEPLIELRRDNLEFSQKQLADAYRKAGLRDDRDLLVKALGMLGSAHAGEREAAIIQVERLRAGRPWNELLV